MRVSAFCKPFRNEGASIKEVAEYCKWKTVNEYSKIQVTFTIVEVSFSGNTAYTLKDNLGMMASFPNHDLKEMVSWLKAHGFKTVHDWYTQGCGMSEETWKEWNTCND